MIKDDIRKRKQKPNESFEDFLDAIFTISDRLRVPMQETELVEIIVGNLKPNLRHELLHFEIISVAD